MSLQLSIIIFLLLLLALFIVLSRGARKTLGVLISSIYWFVIESSHVGRDALRGV